MAGEAQNVNIGIDQGGDTFRIGAAAGRETPHNYEGLRRSLMANDPDFLCVVDHFLGAAVNTRWATDLSTGATVAINDQETGVVRLSTDDTDDDHATLALGLHFLVSKGWTFFEARIKSVTAITARALEFGLSDALSETNGLAFSSHDATPVDVATDAAVFGYNTDESMTTFSALSVKAGGTPQYTLLAGAPSTSFIKLGVLIDSAGNAYFYVNGVLVATHLLAVATTALLTPWITLKSLSGAIKEIDVDYIVIAGEAA